MSYFYKCVNLMNNTFEMKPEEIVFQKMGSLKKRLVPRGDVLAQLTRSAGSSHVTRCVTSPYAHLHR